MRRVLIFLLLLASPILAGEPPGLEVARNHRRAHGARILHDFADLLSIPNVPADPAGLRKTAEVLRDGLKARGAEVALLEIEGAPPIVFGTLNAPGARRTLGIYLHYDGQPVDESAWTYPPFAPTLATGPLDRGGEKRDFPAEGESIHPEWRIYARSAGDDKVPAAALLEALDALARADVALTSNLVFFFEGEEERGSPHLSRYLEEYRKRIDAVDLWLICDGPVHQSRTPQLVFGVRGYTGLDITVYGAERYLHSGHYGNWAPNPALELSRLLAGMKNEEGRVTVPGFYDSVVSLTDREREAASAVPEIDAELRRELGLHSTEASNALLVDRILLPSLNIRGLQSATVGPTARNLIPTRATASIDIRLVKGNEPEAMLDLVEQHLVKQGYTIVRDEPDHATRLAHARLARVDRRSGYPAVRTRMDLPLLQPLIEAASAAAGEPVILMPTLGGSLPLHLFTELLGRPLVIVPIANHDNNQHAPDENLRLGNLWYGIDLFGSVLTMPQPVTPETSAPEGECAIIKFPLFYDSSVLFEQAEFGVPEEIIFCKRQ